MHRHDLIHRLERHRAADDAEERSRHLMLDFVRANTDCFERANQVGHVTGSAWLIDESGERALLTFHRKLGMWLQLGGHADGDPDVLAVAMREAREESGIAEIEPVCADVFDVDVHLIPARKSDPEHFHHDVRFLLRAKSTDLTLSEESRALLWATAEEIGHMDVDASVRRMVRKWVAWRAAAVGGRAAIQ